MPVWGVVWSSCISCQFLPEDFSNDWYEALEDFYEISKIESIIPALDTVHALAYLKKITGLDTNKNVVVNMSGRGDKDLYSVMKNAKN